MPNDRGVTTVDVERARSLTRLLDNAFTIPGTKFRFGLDPIIGLIPGLGDLVGAGASGYLLLLAARAGASRTVLARMLGNVALDALLGTVPLVGDLVDAGWKANARNMALLERHLAAPAATRRASRSVVAVVVLLAFLVVVLGITLAWLVARWLVGQLDGRG